MEVEVLTFDAPIYHIYVKNRCLYNCLKEEEFDIKWATQCDGRFNEN